MKFLAAASALLFLCQCATPSEKRLDLHVKNETGRRLTIVIHAGWLSRTIVLDPGEEFPGWVNRDWVGSKVSVSFK